MPQSVARPEVDEVLARIEGRPIDRLGRTTADRLALRLPPQVVHRVQLRCGLRQQADLNPQLPGLRAALRRLVLGGPVLEQHDVPAAPLRADHRQERLVGLLGPFFGDQPRHITAPNVDRPVEDPLGAVPRDRHADLLPDVARAAIKRGRPRDDCLVKHQQHRAEAALQPAFPPPFDCRQVSERRAS